MKMLDADVGNEYNGGALWCIPFSYSLMLHRTGLVLSVDVFHVSTH